MISTKVTVSPSSNETTGEIKNQRMRQLVRFTIESEEFGTDILTVSEIIRFQPVTKVPNTPKFVEGVINLRGRVVPVLDLRKRLGLESKPAEMKTRIMIIKSDINFIGFVVDEVTGVTSVTEDSIEATPMMVVAGIESIYITGVTKLGEKLLVLLDFDRILSISEKEKLQSLEKLHN